VKKLVVVAAATLALAMMPPAHASARPRTGAEFSSLLASGLRAFYHRNFETARARFVAATNATPGDALALAFVNASAAQVGPDELAALAGREEATVAKAPHDAVARTRLAFTYLFMAQDDSERDADAREALDAALHADPHLAAAHVGMGVYRLNHASHSRAKAEFLAALEIAPRDVLAREYLAGLYEENLGDPNRALSYLIDVPNSVPGYADAYFHIGSIFNDLGQYDAAIRYLRTAIDLDAGHVGEAGLRGLPLLGDIYLKIHRIEEAKRAFALALVFGEEPGYSQMQLDNIKRGQTK
jgi:tetratricopeptide (TPR) repeat protein